MNTFPCGERNRKQSNTNIYDAVIQGSPDFVAGIIIFKRKSILVYFFIKNAIKQYAIVCIRLAYRAFIAQAANFKQTYLNTEGGTLIDETDIADELIRVEDTCIVLESLKTLREIERIIINQRYYGDFLFVEIAKTNGLKLNTVLSHHRRALEKLRPQLTKLLCFRKDESYE